MEQAAWLYDKYEAGRPEPFNIFTALRSASDEVNLHSRFLHALLDYKKAGHAIRENLADFLRHVGVGNFGAGDLEEVKRERNYIDILITTNDGRHAVLIENKIRASDQPKQLCRYYNWIKDQGYSSVHVLYLTLRGNGPSEASFCGSRCQARSHHKAISYKDTLPSWLERCRQRAYNEPGLRESIAQYRQLIQKLTGTDFWGVYMNALTRLCLQGDNGDNLVLGHHLSTALLQAKTYLLQQLWRDIDSALHAKLPILPLVDEADQIDQSFHYASEQRIRSFCIGTQLYHGLFYPLGGGAFLGIEAGNGNCLLFGVACIRNRHRARHDELRNKLACVPDGEHGENSPKWPWYRYADGLRLRNPNDEDLRILLNKNDRGEHAARSHDA